MAKADREQQLEPMKLEPGEFEGEPDEGLARGAERLVRALRPHLDAGRGVLEGLRELGVTLPSPRRSAAERARRERAMEQMFTREQRLSPLGRKALDLALRWAGRQLGGDEREQD